MISAGPLHDFDPLIGPDPSLYVDRAVLLGKDRALAAIVTSPTQAIDADLPTVVQINTGIVHRVGHHRMFVMLSRALGAMGHRVVRFDLAGIGDSERRSDSLSDLEGEQADIGEVLDWLEKTYGVRRVVLMGLCWGANRALIRATTDQRVVGMVLVDPSVPRTRRYYMNRLMQPRRWGIGPRNLQRTLARLQALRDSARGTGDGTALRLNHPTVKNFLRNAYQSVVDADDKILAVFTAGLEFQHNYREQLIDAFPEVNFGDRLKLVYFGESDHTFTWEAHRGRFFRLILEWMATTKFRQDAGNGEGEEEVAFI